MYTDKMHTFFQKDACFLHTSVATNIPQLSRSLSVRQEQRTEMD